MTFSLMWWVVLFILLPFGVRKSSASKENIKVKYMAAPDNQNVLKKIFLTTLIATILTFAIQLSLPKLAWLLEVKWIDI